jgi:hypothetical protein
MTVKIVVPTLGSLVCKRINQLQGDAKAPNVSGIRRERRP